MAKNPAAARHAKALRRRKVVAEKKRADAFATSVAGAVLAALEHPIQHCMINQGFDQTGMAQVWIGRGATPFDTYVAVFLVDLLLLGVKDAFGRPMTGREMEDALDHAAGYMPMQPVDPATARKLLREAVAWARGKRVQPHPDYEVLESLFGDADPAHCDAVFRFGLAGPRVEDGPMEGPVIDGEATQPASGFDSPPAER